MTFVTFAGFNLKLMSLNFAIKSQLSVFNLFYGGENNLIKMDPPILFYKSPFLNFDPFSLLSEVRLVKRAYFYFSQKSTV